MTSIELLLKPLPLFAFSSFYRTMDYLHLLQPWCIWGLVATKKKKFTLWMHNNSTNRLLYSKKMVVKNCGEFPLMKDYAKDLAIGMIITTVFAA